MREIKKLCDSNPFDHEVGDIILTNSIGLSAEVNKLIQKGLYKANWNSKATHALLCYGNAIFCEATFNKPLSAFSFQDDNRNSNKVEYRVIRNKKLKENRNKQEELKKEMEHHLLKEYKVNLLLKIFLKISGKRSEMFCSQFVVEAFKKVGIDIIKDLGRLGKNSNKVMPIDLEKLLETKDWEEVEYGIFDESNINMQMLAKSLLGMTLNMRSQTAKVISELEETSFDIENYNIKRLGDKRAYLKKSQKNLLELKLEITSQSWHEKGVREKYKKRLGELKD